jgi:HAD superfamily hydrolase (TIGR01509 family)
MRLDWLEIDTVLLDMDGTLLDLSFDSYFWRELVPREYAGSRGLAVGDAVAIVEGHYQRVYGTLDWYCVDYWSRTLDLDIRALKARASDRVAYLPESVRFLKAMAALGKRLVLVTNAHQDALAIKLARTDLADRVDRMFSSHEFHYPKEHAEFWVRLQDREPFDRQRTLFIDDSLPVLAAARAFGIGHLVAIRCPDSTEPARVVEDFPAVDSVADLLGA